MSVNGEGKNNTIDNRTSQAVIDENITSAVVDDVDIDINDDSVETDELIDDEIQKEVKKKSNVGRNIFNVLFLGLVFGLTLYGVFRGEDLENVLDGLTKTDLSILIVPSIICVLIFVMMESVIFKYLFNTLGIKVRLPRAFLYSFVGFFFSAITPSASGGQPAQLIFMRKDKISLAHSTIVLILVTIAYKMVLVVLGGIALIFRPARIMESIGAAEFWIWLGIVLNVIAIAGMLFFVYVPSLARKVLIWCVNLLNKIRILKDREKWLYKTEDLMNKYESASQYLKTHKRVLFNAFLLSIIQRVALFFVTVIVYWSFHLQGTSIIDILVLQCLISLAVDMLPLPGGMGMSERLFLLMFTGVFKDLTLPAMILSRGFSYYIQLLICAVMTVVAYIVVFWIPNRKKNKNMNRSGEK